MAQRWVRGSSNYGAQIAAHFGLPYCCAWFFTDGQGAPQALDIYREAAEVTKLPFIYLSAGVSNDQFTESLRWAAESEVSFSGVLCGRSNWKQGIPIYGE